MTKMKMSARCDVLGLMSVAALMLVLTGAACGDLSDDEASIADSVRELLGGEGGVLQGKPGSALEGLRLEIPAGALKAPTMITVREAEPTTKLPNTAVQVGRSVTLEPTGLTLSAPASLTLPFDTKAVSDRKRQAEDVRLWVLEGEQWKQLLQERSSAGSITVRLASLFGSTAPGLPADGY